jgi:translation initiation factor 1
MSNGIVYRSGVGRICPGCGWPVADCRCSKGGRSDATIPSKITAKLRLEKKGRGGKTVTVIDGLPDNTAFLEELAAALKKSCGVGGTIRPGAVELAGDVTDRVRPLLSARGFAVKG